MARAAVPDLKVGLIAHLRANVPMIVVAGTPQVWTRPLPKHAVFPRLVVGEDATEGYFGFYGSPGSESSLLLKGYWRQDPARPQYGSGGIDTLWAQTYAALEGVEIVVAGHQRVTGELRLQAMYPDPDGVTLQFAARYTALTLVEA